jgi:hypothetical protein
VSEEGVVDELIAQVDGEDWSGPNTLFQSSTTGVLMGFTQGPDDSMTIRLKTSTVYSVNEELETIEREEGVDASGLYDNQEDSTYEVGDGSREGSDVVLLVDGTTKHTSNGSRGGFLSITFDSDAGTLSGCGWFDAEEQDGGEVSYVTDLSFVLTLQ